MRVIKVMHMCSFIDGNRVILAVYSYVFYFYLKIKRCELYLDLRTTCDDMPTGRLDSSEYHRSGSSGQATQYKETVDTFRPPRPKHHCLYQLIDWWARIRKNQRQIQKV